jgi:hypothetical protein
MQISKKFAFEQFDLMPQKTGFLGVEDKYLKSPDQVKVVVVPFGLEKVSELRRRYKKWAGGDHQSFATS